GERFDERTAGMVDEVRPVEVPGALFGDLADAAGGGMAMARSAAVGVERRPDAVGDRLDVFEDLFVEVEGRLVGVAVRESVESCGGFRDRLHPRGGRQGEATDDG